MITTRITQKEPYNQYSVGSCDPDVCHPEHPNNCDWNVYGKGIEVKDWEYGQENCFNKCSETLVCSQLNPSICPSIRGDVNIKWDPEKGAPHVLCEYPLENFQTVEDIKTYLNIQGENDVYNLEIMPYFCSQSVQTCPENLEKNRFLSCSKFVSNGVDGNMCREWSSRNPEISDKSIINYCEKNGTEDCTCISENKPDVCSRYHCANPSYLTTSHIKEKVRSCSILAKEDINDQKSSANSSSVWVWIIVLVLVILSLIAWFGIRYYDKIRN